MVYSQVLIFGDVWHLSKQIKDKPVFKISNTFVVFEILLLMQTRINIKKLEESINWQ